MSIFTPFSFLELLQAIPHAVAMVRTADGKSPREAVEFVLQLLKVSTCVSNPFYCITASSIMSS